MKSGAVHLEVMLMLSSHRAAQSSEGIPSGPSDPSLFNSRYSTLVAAEEVTSVVSSVEVMAASVEYTTSTGRLMKG